MHVLDSFSCISLLAHSPSHNSARLRFRARMGPGVVGRCSCASCIAPGSTWVRGLWYSQCSVLGRSRGLPSSVGNNTPWHIQVSWVIIVSLDGSGFRSVLDLSEGFLACGRGHALRARRQPAARAEVTGRRDGSRAVALIPYNRIRKQGDLAMVNEKPSRPEEAIRKRLYESIGEVFSQYQDCIYEMVSIFQTLGYQEGRAPVLQLLNQAANDFYDLGNELEAGRGRAATRTARALIEHTINFYSIASDDEILNRYGDQFSVSIVLEKNSMIGANELPKKERKVYLNNLEKSAKEHQKKSDAAISKYGSSFRRQWHQVNLYDRAVQHGIQDLYDYYKMASVVMHGSSGGAKGTLFSIEGQSIYRLGPALNLCPLAYREGIRAFSMLVEKMGDVIPEAGASSLANKLSELKGLWPIYRREILALDKEMTPKSASEVSHCCALISGTGTLKWAIVSPSDGWVMLCHEPDLYRSDVRFRDSMNEMRIQVQSQFAENHWEPIGLPGASLTPLSGGKKYPTRNFFDQGQWDELVINKGFKRESFPGFNSAHNSF